MAGIVALLGRQSYWLLGSARPSDIWSYSDHVRGCEGPYLQAKPGRLWKYLKWPKTDIADRVAGPTEDLQDLVLFWGQGLDDTSTSFYDSQPAASDVFVGYRILYSI